MEQDGSRYFGPYTAAWSVRETLDVLRRAFPYLTCDRQITGKDERACLYYDIKLCNAPCIGKVSREEYRANIQKLMDFLGGHSQTLVEDNRQRMTDAAGNPDFLPAAALRDQLIAIGKGMERQEGVSAIY